MSKWFLPCQTLLPIGGFLGLLVGAVALDCWAGDFTAATCCDQSHGPRGNPSCWDSTYTYEACCGNYIAPKRKKEVPAAKGTSVARTKQSIDGVVVGIDLGTTYSAVAICRNGRTEVIANDQGNRITPSVVSFLESGERLVGESAKNVLSSHPKNTVYDAKRLIGRGFQDRSVQMDKKTFPFRVIDRAGRPHIEIDRGKKRRVVLAPEEISAMVLQRMKTIAEAYLGEAVRHAVVTVPAYFTDNQRSATMVAGEIAGLNIVRIINEPTAAAIAYGFDNRRPRKGRSETKVLVYDLGGGTFDVSLLSIDNGVFEVLATCGNTHLGGEDFDQNVMRYVADEFKKKTGKDPSNDRQAMQKLKMAVEKAKRVLSTTVKTTVEVEAFYQSLDLNIALSRSKFENLNAELFSKTLEPVKRVLKDAGIQKQDINEVVMVGGSTRIPKVQQIIQEFFGLAKPPKHKVNPDEAVAIGAAIQGELLWRGSSAGQALIPGHKTMDIVLVDVTPLSLGIEIEGGHMVVLIPRNSVLPTQKTKTFTTVQEKQNHVYIPIYQGERKVAAKNNKLGEMILSGIPPAPVGVPQIGVTFRIDTNGILHVTAQDQGTKQEASVTISALKGRLSDEDIERMVRKAQRHAEEDRDMLARADARAAFRTYIDSLRSSVLDAPKTRLSEDDELDLKTAVKEAIDWLQERSDASVDDLQERRGEVENVANPIVARMYGHPAPTPKHQNDDSSGDDDSDVPYGDDDDEEIHVEL